MLVIDAPTRARADGATQVFDRIVCGVDGSDEALEAARQAATLRAPGGVLRIAAVADLNLAVHAGFAACHVMNEVDATSRHALHGAIDAVRPESSHLLVGDPASMLLDAARRFDASLVAVGPRGHSRAVGIILGGVTTSLLHEAPCSVLVARRHPGHGRFPERILVGVDGSAESLEAARVAETLAERFGSKLMLAAATGGKPIDLDAVRAAGTHFIADPGRPVEALSELAEDFDLVVVGSRGLHGVRSLGSVSERVAHRAPSSVLVVRSTQDED